MSRQNKKQIQETEWKQLQEESVNKIIRERLKPLTKGQERYFSAINNSIVTLCNGKAGVGKTYISCGLAAQFLREKNFQKIVLTRPMITCGKGIGFLPGDIQEKVSPHMRALLDAFEEFFDKEELDKLIENKTIELCPLELMRGMSIKNAVIICDEAQNAEYVQLHMLLTRFGTGSKVIVSGDASQTDLTWEKKNPLGQVIKRLTGHKDISIVHLGREDIVRHPLIQFIDEKLSDAQDSFDLYNDPWYNIKCPSCQKQLWFLNYGKDDCSDDNVEFVKCCFCKTKIEMSDDEGIRQVLGKPGEFFEKTFPNKQ